MQALYAFRQAKESDYWVAQDELSEAFDPDLNLMEIPSKASVETQKKAALRAFEASYLTKVIPPQEDITTKVYDEVVSAIRGYHQAVEKDYKHFARMMMIEVEDIYENYLLILQLLAELAQKAETEKNRKLINPMAVKLTSDYKLCDNQVIRMLQEQTAEELVRKNLTWKDETDLITDFYQILKKDDEYQKYAKIPFATFEEDREMADYIIRTYIFKKTSDEEADNIGILQAFFEERDLNWAENRDILKSMTTKTLKSIQEGKPEEFRLVEISADWQADKQFFADLYHKTIENEPKYEPIIAEKAQNWKSERIVLVDKILLLMALTEMTHFSSIPIKVTINEYIELSKKYSTPKSKTFINGLLDVISEELIANGDIKKSGRGLMDNK
jgi:transcription antitermination protein NusB